MRWIYISGGVSSKLVSGEVSGRLVSDGVSGKLSRLMWL